MDTATRRRQKWLIFFCWLIYTCVYLGRYSYSANVAVVIDAYGTTKAAAGLVTSAFFFSYGAGQFIHGALCRYYPKKYVLTGVLILSAALNLFVYFGAPFYLFKYFWILNGLAQSVLWSSLILLLSQNIEGDMMKTAILVMSTTTAVGTFLSYGAASLFNAVGGFRYSFLLGAVVLLTTGLLWFFVYDRITAPCDAKRLERKETPMPSVKRKRNAAFYTVFFSLVFFAIADNLVRDGVTTWTPVVLKGEYHLPDSLSILVTLVLPMLSIFGAMSSVYFNKYIKDYVSLGGVFFAVAVLGLFGIVLLLETSAWVAMILASAVVAMMMSAINNVIVSIAPIYMRAYMNSGALSGILNGFCYLGSTVASYGIGWLADRYAWSLVFTVLTVICVLPVVYAALRAIALLFIKKKASP